MVVLVVRKAILRLQCSTLNQRPLSTSRPPSRSGSIRSRPITGKRGSMCIEREAEDKPSESDLTRSTRRRPSPPDTNANSSSNESLNSDVTQSSCNSDLPMLPTPPPSGMEVFSPLQGFDMNTDGDVFSFNDFIKPPSEPLILAANSRGASVSDQQASTTNSMQQGRQEQDPNFEVGPFSFFTPESSGNQPTISLSNCNRMNTHIHSRNHSLSHLPQGPATPPRQVQGQVPTHRHTISLPQTTAPPSSLPLASSYPAFRVDLLDSSFTNSNYQLAAPHAEPSTWDDYMDFGSLDMLGTMMDGT